MAPKLFAKLQPKVDSRAKPVSRVEDTPTSSLQDTAPKVKAERIDESTARQQRYEANRRAAETRATVISEQMRAATVHESATVKLEVMPPATPSVGEVPPAEVAGAPTHVEGTMPGDAVGVAFLRRVEDEDRTTRRANARLFLDQRTRTLNSRFTSEEPVALWAQVPAMPRSGVSLGPHETGGMPQGFAHGSGEGRVGTLRVHRNGRVTLTLDGPGASPQPRTFDVATDAAAEAVHTELHAARSDGTLLRLHNLGQFQRKVVLTPNWTKSM